ncbi:hypothetical protein DFH07DRAFT_910354 [Mycena maculata]|uniref:BTB domain-containing protein n=1 Tax=Mycena maculata TaxID=230809 RepID=A0AAD7NYR2_9AGAR|nr:hypothetical protein DFH07DRAFT_910354 [Mycena maculata]
MQQTSESTPTKVDDLWFSTDVIVIRAEDKIFRVSGGVLAARSTVFQDMIAFPQPISSDTEQIDGSPVVRLHDSASDVEVFLRAIYDSRYVWPSYFMPAPASAELWVVLGILRLSHKYDVQYLYRRALDHLAEDGWDCRTFNSVHCPQSPAKALSVISTAMEVGAQWLLPLAYYYASNLSAKVLLIFLDGPMAPYARTCLGTHSSVVRGAVVVNRFLTVQDSLCATPDSCSEIRHSFLSDFLDAVADGSELQPLSNWDIWTRLNSDGMCDDCCSSAKVQHHHAATTFFEQLPDIFGLPPWDGLHTTKRAAMGETDSVDD